MVTLKQNKIRWWILTNSVLIFVVVVGYGQMHVVMEVNDILADLQLSLADWGGLWSAISFGALITAIVGGTLGDRFGVRRVIGFGVLMMGITLGLRGTATSFSQMYLWMFLFGVALALPFTNIPKALGTWFPQEELGLANGSTQAGFGLGGGLAGVLTPLLLLNLGGWREVSYLLGTVAVVIAVIWFFTIPEPEKAADEQQGQTGAKEGLLQVLKIRDLWIVAICNMLLMGSFLGIIGYVATYLIDERAMTPGAAGFVVSLVLWSYIGGAILLPSLSDRIGLRRTVIFPSLLVASICMLLAAYATGMSLWIVAIVWGITAGAAPLAFVIPLEMKGIGPGLAGSAIGIIVTTGYLGGMVSPIIGMGLAEARPIAGFFFWSGCYILAACLFLVVKETGPKVGRI